MEFIGGVQNIVRRVVRSVSKMLNGVTGGKLSPNTVTLVGLIAHIPIAWLIFKNYLPLAGVLLIVFGLFDTLDGELARLQKTESAKGMFLDSFSDKVKEVVLYTASAYNIISVTGRPYLAVWAVAACGTSLLVSYANASGEAVVAKYSLSSHTINKAFRVGIAGFEVRMAVLVLGLLSGRLTLAMITITLLASLTALQRFVYINRSLEDVQD